MVLMLLVVACGDDDSVTDPTERATVSGVVSGLADGAQLVLLNNNAGRTIITSNGPFVLSEPVLHGKGYSITVGEQPSGQFCGVANGNRQNVTGDVTDVVVTCSTQTYTISGTVAGMAANQRVTLRNNGIDATTIKQNGAFSFNSPIASGEAYLVTVDIHPDGQQCFVDRGSGVDVQADVTDVEVACRDQTYAISGVVSGLEAGRYLMLENNRSDAMMVAANGPFSFGGRLTAGETYSVTVSHQPFAQTCSVTGGNGVVIDSDVANIKVVCGPLSYTVSGTVNGLGPGKQFTLLNGLDSTTVTEDGPFTFPERVIHGQDYSITVSTHPAGQVCMINNGAGLRIQADVENLEVTCVDAIPISGNILTNSTWHSGESYVLLGDVGVAKEATLTIEPGVTIYHDRGRLIVAGRLLAVGGTNRRITFAALLQGGDSPRSGPVGEVRFENSVGSKVEYAIFKNIRGIFLNGNSVVPFRNSTFTGSSGVFADNGGYQYVDIQHCTFIGNDVVFSGIRTLGATISYNLFLENGSVFQHAYYFGDVTVAANDFIDNDFVIEAPVIGYGYGTVDVRSNWWGTTDTSVIDALIYDGRDEVTLQTLIYLPISGKPNGAGAR